MAYSYTGRRLIADILEDITGLTEWVDYFPVQYDETTDTATKGGALIITDEGGPGDNHPVYLVTGRTLPFVCNSDGYVPIIDAPVIPSSYPVLLDFVATLDGEASLNGTTHTVDIPAHSTGDLLVFAVGTAGSSDLNAVSGWNTYEGTARWPMTATRRITVLWKIAASDSAASTVTVSLVSAGTFRRQAIAFVIQAGTFDVTTPLEVTPTANYLDTGLSGATTLVPATVTPSWGSDATLWLPFMFHTFAILTQSIIVSTETTEHHYVPSAVGTSNWGVAFYSKEETVATLSPATFEAFNGASPYTSLMCGATIAIKPA